MPQQFVTFGARYKSFENWISFKFKSNSHFISESYRILNEMFSFCYLIILSIGLHVLWAQDSKEFHVCDEILGDTEIRAVFRWKQNLFLFTQNGLQFRVKNFVRGDPVLTFDTIERLDPTKWKTTSQMKLITSVDYPGKGLRVLEIDLGKVWILWVLRVFTTYCLKDWWNPTNEGIFASIGW